MNTGLTIAFICNGDKHPTIINHKIFGNEYWDDTPDNKSKIGYYFVYYFRKKYVYVHKIENILQPSKRPPEMTWKTDRQILCLSKHKITYNWNDWISGIGLGAPYTPKYGSTQTSAWSYDELKNHKKFKTFNFKNFENIIKQQCRDNQLVEKIPCTHENQTEEENQ